MARPRITVDLWTDAAGFDVLASLDRHDIAEVEAGLGRAGLAAVTLFAEWRAAAAGAMLSVVVSEEWSPISKQPFAVLALRRAGVAGVAEAAFLARDHRLFHRPIVEAALRIRDGMPDYAERAGLNRIEARCWASHPTAARFLAAVGFQHEADLNGFGATGAETFRQFAWVAPGCTSPKRT